MVLPDAILFSHKINVNKTNNEEKSEKEKLLKIG